MTSHALQLLLVLIVTSSSSSSSVSGFSHVRRPETREARAGNYVSLGDVDGCSDADLGKTSRYYFVENQGVMNDQEFLCDTDLSNDGSTASRLVVINSQRENDCIIKYIIQSERGGNFFS